MYLNKNKSDYMRPILTFQVKNNCNNPRFDFVHFQD